MISALNLFLIMIGAIIIIVIVAVVWSAIKIISISYGKCLYVITARTEEYIRFECAICGKVDTFYTKAYPPERDE